MSSRLYNYTKEELQSLLDTSNSYKEILEKTNLNPKGRNPETLKKIIEEFKLDTTQLDKNRKKFFQNHGKKVKNRTKINIKDVLLNKKNMQSNRLLKLLVENKYKEYKCENCGITDWNNKPIVLQLHHKDGNHKNNNLNNLQILCPNCHSQTDSFAGKNSRKKNNNIKIKETKKSLPPISREELKRRIRNDSFVNIGKDYNVSCNSIKKWCVKYNLPKRTKDIRIINDNDWENI